MLDLVDVSGGWGPTLIVENVTLSLERGERVALLGRNGVGKSTLLELIVGRARRHSGVIRVGERAVSELPIHERARAGLGYVPQSREVFPSLSVREHLEIAARPGAWSIGRVIELFPRLEERRASLGSQLSGGEQQMLSVARALIGNPSVLLLDEPFEGLAPVVVEMLVASLGRICSEGSLAMLLVEQRVDIALGLSERCLIMDHGHLVWDGDSEQLRADPLQVASLMGLH